MKWRKNCLWLCILLAVTLSACSDMFDTHPYDVNFKGEIGIKIGISVTAVQKHINKLKSLRFIDRDGSTGHGNWRVIK